MAGAGGVDDSSTLKLAKDDLRNSGPALSAMEPAGLKVTSRDARMAGSKMNDLAKKWTAHLSLISVSRSICFPFARK